MSKQSMDSRMEEAKISLDALVPKNHLVRKLVFIQYLFGIRSMRQTIKEVKQT